MSRLSPLRKIPWAELAGPALVTLLVVYYYGRLLLGEFPLSHDHPAHLFNAWLTSDVLLPQGRLTGWSDLWFAGYPANELYGPGGNLWVTLFRYATFGALDYGATYGLAIFALMLLVPLSTYVLGRALLGRAAGTFAAVAMVLTRGGWYDLGWFWIVEMGVWPYALGAALTCLAIVVLRRYLQRGGPAGLALAALAIAAAVVGHPMSLLLLGLVGPLVLLHVWLENGRGDATRVLLRGASAGGLGVALTAFWLIPFVAKSAYSQKLGEIWLELPDAVPTMVQLNLLGTEWRLVLGLAVVGGILGVVRRHIWALFLVTSALAMIVFASATTHYELRLFDVLSPLASIQYPRFVGFVRILAYLLAGYGFAELLRVWTPGWQDLKRAPWTQKVRAGLLVGLPLCLLLPFGSGAF
ncbi:MAG: putative membrane protein, partial [Myxococcota bacterium]